MKTIILASAAVASLALSVPAGAYCRNVWDTSLSCQRSIMTPTNGSVAFYMSNPIVRQMQIRDCSTPGLVIRPPAAWCANARQAQAFTMNGSR